MKQVTHFNEISNKYHTTRDHSFFVATP